jgi:succinoglycan biosynthesis transport protein ExoP
MARRDSTDFVDYFHVLSRRKFTLIAAATLGALLGLLVTRFQTPVYRARALIEIEKLNEGFLNIRDVSLTEPQTASDPPEYNVRTQITILQSRPILERALQKVNLESRLVARNHSIRSNRPVHNSADAGSVLHRKALKALQAGLRIRPESNTRVLEVTYDSFDPQIAADAVNSLVTAFGEVSLENRWRVSQNTSQWLTRQLQDVKAKLAKSEDALQAYARRSNLTFLPENNNQNTTEEERLKQLQVELSKAQAERLERQSRYELASSASVDSLPEVLDNPTLKDYQLQLTQLRRQPVDLSSTFTANYPKVVSLRAQIAMVENAFAKERSNIISRSQNEFNAAVRREQLVAKAYAGVCRPHVGAN